MSGYNRDTVVNCLTRHYELLVRMGYMDASVVQLPPAGSGWSDAELRVDALRAMGRSETVIDLLRHIPYLRENETADPVEVYTETFPLRYLRDGRWFGSAGGVGGGGGEGEDFERTAMLDLGFAPFDGPVPAGMVSLTHADEGIWWLVDTDEGCIYPYGTEFEGEEQAPEGEPWKAVEAVPIETYFDNVYAQVGNLDVVPAPRSGKWDARVVEEHTEEGQLVKGLYREFGWPDAFRKEEFVHAVEQNRASFLEAGLGDDDEDEEMAG